MAGPSGRLSASTLLTLCSIGYVALFTILYLVYYDDVPSIRCFTTPFNSFFWPISLTVYYLAIFLNLIEYCVSSLYVVNIKTGRTESVEFNPIKGFIQILYFSLNIFNLIWLIIGTVWFATDTSCVSTPNTIPKIGKFFKLLFFFLQYKGYPLYGLTVTWFVFNYLLFMILFCISGFFCCASSALCIIWIREKRTVGDEENNPLN